MTLDAPQQKELTRFVGAVLITIFIVLFIVRYAVQQYFRKEMARPS